MTSRAAARAFVTNLIERHLSDVMILVDGFASDDPMDREREALYARVEDTLREEWGLTKADTETLYDEVIAAAPDGYTDAVQKAVERLDIALTEDASVKQQAGFLIGCEFLRALLAIGPVDSPYDSATSTGKDS